MSFRLGLCHPGAITVHYEGLKCGFNLTSDCPQINVQPKLDCL